MGIFREDTGWAPDVAMIQVAPPDPDGTCSLGISVDVTKAAALEWAPLKIRVNSVHPGYIDTPMSRPDWADYTAAGSQPAHVALGRTGRPDEVSGVVCFLLSDEATYCTGAEFVVDGGLTSVIPAREGIEPVVFQAPDR